MGSAGARRSWGVGCGGRRGVAGAVQGGEVDQGKGDDGAESRVEKMRRAMARTARLDRGGVLSGWRRLSWRCRAKLADVEGDAASTPLREVSLSGTVPAGQEDLEDEEENCGEDDDGPDDVERDPAAGGAARTSSARGGGGGVETHSPQCLHLSASAGMSDCRRGGFHRVPYCRMVGTAVGRRPDDRAIPRHLNMSGRAWANRSWG